MLWVAIIASIVVIYWVASFYAHRFRMYQLIMLKNRLREYKVIPEKFSAECLAELLDVGTLRIKDRSKSEAEYARQVSEAVHGIAANVAFINYGDGDCSAERIKTEIQKYNFVNVFWKVLAKHDPKRFELEELEKTQAVNAHMRSMAQN